MNFVNADTETKTIHVTIFCDEFAKTLDVKNLTLAKLRELVLTTTAATKAALPLLKLAVFGDKRTANDCLRSNANVREITGVEVDYDGKEMALETAISMLKAAGLASLAYTSPNYAKEKPKWRVVLPTSRPLDPKERAKLVARVNGVLGGIIAGESFTLSQSFYFGSINGNPDHRAELTDGDFVDLRADLDAGAIDKVTTASLKEATGEATGFDAILATIGDRDGHSGFHEPTMRAIASYVSTHDRDFDRTALKVLIRNAIIQAPKKPDRDVSVYLDDDRELDKLIDGAIEKFGANAPVNYALDGLTDEQQTEVRRLADLSAVHYDAQRKEAAKRFNVRTSTLDRIVESLHPRAADDENLQGTALTIPETALWPEPVNGAELIENMEKAIKEHVILDDDQALATTLWCIHTHAREAAEHYPRLHISSPAKRCGKTTLLRSTAPMVSRPLSTEHISNAALFRTIEMAKPTLIIDEVDTFLKDNDDMLRLLNAGHTRNGQVIRTVGEDFEPRSFSVAGPVIIAGIGRIPTTLEDRSITIPLRRRLKNEQIKRLRSNRTAHLDRLGRQAARWVADHIITLANADPELPGQLNDRQQDNWRPLIAITDAISDDLGKRTRQAAIAISSDDASEDDDVATMLLNDVAAIMDERRQDQPRKNSSTNWSGWTTVLGPSGGAVSP
jgi:hypothetical protein